MYLQSLTSDITPPHPAAVYGPLPLSTKDFCPFGRLHAGRPPRRTDSRWTTAGLLGPEQHAVGQFVPHVPGLHPLLVAHLLWLGGGCRASITLRGQSLLWTVTVRRN